MTFIGEFILGSIIGTAIGTGVSIIRGGGLLIGKSAKAYDDAGQKTDNADDKTVFSEDELKNYKWDE